MSIEHHEVRLPSGLRLVGSVPATPHHQPLLLIPGLFAGAWSLELWQHRFAEHGWPAWTVELRGRPGSRGVQDLGRVSMDDYAEDALEAAAHLGAPLVVGHSMGGLLAQRVAAEGRARAVVLLCSAPPAGIPVISPLLLRYTLPHLGALLRSRPFAGSAAQHEAVALHRMPTDQRPAILARLAPDSGRVGRELALGRVRVDATAVRCPVLSLVGDEDRFVPPRVGKALAARYHCALWSYAEHAHFLVAEPGWERIFADVERWLAHVETLQEHEAAYEKLWAQLQRLIGEEVTLRFHDGRRVEVEVVNVDLARHRDVIYEVRRVVSPGPGSMRQPVEGETARSAVYELAGLGPVESTGRGSA